MRGPASLLLALAFLVPLGVAAPTTLGALPAPADDSPDAEAPAFANDSEDVRQFLEAAMKETKGENIYSCIEEVTQSPPTMYRLMGTPTHDMFVQKYAKVFSSISPRIKDQVVRIPLGGLAGNNNVRPGGDNIIGVLPGANLSKWVVLGGHYDNREGTVGAIDNTSGICTVKELARAAVALDLQPEATLVFAWWDGEEWGLYGSTSFVRDHSATKELLGLTKDAPVTIAVGQSWDIVGINYPAYNTWIGYGEPANVNEYAILNLRTAPTDVERSKRLYGRLNLADDEERQYNFSMYAGLVKEVAHRLLKLPADKAYVHDDQYGRSDHVPFIGAGIPGMRIQGSHDCGVGGQPGRCQWPHYHQPTDTLASAVVMAGGQDKLIAGFNAAAEAGGLTALYVARQGDYGMYTNMTDPSPELPLVVVKDVPAKATPGVHFVFVVAVAAAIVAAFRRRA